MRELIKKHGLILLNLYGVKEKTIDNSPEALTAFINILEEEIEQEIKKVQHDNEILVNTILDTPMGISQWKEIGIKYGYYEYFRREEVKKIVEEIKEEVLSAKYGTKNRVELLCKLNSYLK